MESLHLGLCKKNSDRKVIFQDEMCLSICGNVTGQVCDKGCMSAYVPTQGMTLVRNSSVENSVVDAVVINDGSSITTLLHSKAKTPEEIQADERKLTTYGLSKSERVIFLLVMKGKMNSQIQKDLFISKATLKTHLNNIYKKLPENYQQYKKRR